MYLVILLERSLTFLSLSFNDWFQAFLLILDKDVAESSRPVFAEQLSTQWSTLITSPIEIKPVFTEEVIDIMGYVFYKEFCIFLHDNVGFVIPRGFPFHFFMSNMLLNSYVPSFQQHLIIYAYQLCKLYGLQPHPSQPFLGLYSSTLGGQFCKSYHPQGGPCRNALKMDYLRIC